MKVNLLCPVWGTARIPLIAQKSWGNHIFVSHILVNSNMLTCEYFEHLVAKKQHINFKYTFFKICLT